jgi:hypothetical protein
MDSGGVDEPKKRLSEDAELLKTGSRKSDGPTGTLAEDIDPAEFFDPEEFGYRRRDVKSFNP